MYGKVEINSYRNIYEINHNNLPLVSMYKSQVGAVAIYAISVYHH
jgi:hypothetical protein